MRTIRTSSGQRNVNTAFRRALTRAGEGVGPFRVTYPGGRDQVSGIYFRDLDLWVAFQDIQGSRWWHGLNVGDPMANAAAQQIAVEVNIPMQEARHRTQGVALEDEKGRYWVGHRGRLGGNSASIGAGFLDWYPDGRTVVIDQGRETEIILLGCVDDPELPALLRRFVDLAHLYKAGGTPASPPDKDSFRSEFTGEKSVDVQKRKYVTAGTHGIVVQALHEALGRLGVPSFNDRHRDLYTGSAGSMLACFEVKTSTSTTDCYTAVGQLLLHGGTAKHRVFVAPSGQLALQPPIEDAGVAVLRYDLQQGKVSFKGLKKLVASTQS